MLKIVFLFSLATLFAFGQVTHFSECTGSQLYSLNPKDSRFYFVCIENRWIKKMCPENHYYLTLNGKCIEFPFPNPLPTVETCKVGEKIELTPYWCYSECGEDGNFQMGKCCKNGTFYSKSSEKCIPIPPISSNPEFPDHSCNETFIAHPQFCGHYYKCTNDNWELLECEIGTVWNQSIRECSEDTSQCPTIGNVTSNQERIIITLD